MRNLFGCLFINTLKFLLTHLWSSSFDYLRLSSLVYPTNAGARSYWLTKDCVFSDWRFETNQLARNACCSRNHNAVFCLLPLGWKLRSHRNKTSATSENSQKPKLPRNAEVLHVKRKKNKSKPNRASWEAIRQNERTKGRSQSLRATYLPKEDLCASPHSFH